PLAHLLSPLRQPIIVMPPLICAIASPVTCTITPCTCTWICPCTLMTMPLSVTPVWSTLTLLCPTFSSIDCIASVSLLPRLSFVVWLPILIVRPSLPMSICTSRLPFLIWCVSLPVSTSTVRLPVLTWCRSLPVETMIVRLPFSMVTFSLPSLTVSV